MIYKVYVGIGIVSVAVMASCVIYSVIMRYVFNISHLFLEEFITVTFAFSTFWGLGICTIENEHITIDFLYNKVTGLPKKILTIVNTLIVLLVNTVMLYYSLRWVKQTGMHLSNGMHVPTKYLYGIVPVSTVIGIICILIKLVQAVMAPVSPLKVLEETSVITTEKG